MIRIISKRMNEMYLKEASRRTSILLAAASALILFLWWAWLTWHTTGHFVWLLVTGTQLLVAVWILYSTIRMIQQSTWHGTKHAYADGDLPSLTVAIPARNETDDLRTCLESVVRSDYPKLEVIVLDDCSQTKHANEIVRSFAQAGVRFVQGSEPEPSWLPKNLALDRLAQEASGSYVLFCSVDVQFKPDSIRKMVAYCLNQQKQMLSVLPAKHTAATGTFSVLQVMRYWRELGLPTVLRRRPPVLSGCWLINKNALRKAGGFAAVARAIQPEAYFARHLAKTHSYAFALANEIMGITSNKLTDDQHATAIRMRYPQVRRRPEYVARAAALTIGFLLLPGMLVPIGFWVSIGVGAQLMAALAYILLSASYAFCVVRTGAGTAWAGVVRFPLALLFDVFFLHYSMYRYEFTSVDWKGRNVSVPVMHIAKRFQPTTL